MSLRVKNNIPALKTLNTLNKNSKALTNNMRKLSSGQRITGAADDPSGYAISERMRVQIRGLEQDVNNAQSGMSLLKTAEGAISSTVNVLGQMKELAINAANDTNTDDDRATIQKQFDQFIDQIDENAMTTFNGKLLTDGSKNIKGTNVYNVFANTNYAYMGVNSSQTKPLTEWMDKEGHNLNIQKTDQVTISMVWQGKTYAGTYAVGDKSLTTLAIEWKNDMTNTRGLSGLPPEGLPMIERFHKNGQDVIFGYDAQNRPVPLPEDVAGAHIYSPYRSSEAPPLLQDGDEGLDYQIGAFSISFSDSKGNVKKSVNTVFDDYREVIRAANKSDDNAFSFQIGTKANQSIKVGLGDMRAYALALTGKDGSKINIGTRENANAAIGVVENALQKVLDEQTKIGAALSRMEYTISNLTTASENTQAAESVIRDADMAKEMTEYTKNNVLLQAAQSMLSQANQNASSVLSLLQ